MKKILIILFLILTLPCFVYAANICVGASATGSGNGSDWNNQAAWSGVSFVRGNTYYLADGSYGGKSLITATSGSTWIYVKKAIESDHGTATGWLSSYGDGQATFTAEISFGTSYWEFNGQTRNENNWRETASYGFRINVGIGEGIYCLYFDEGTYGNITVKYVDMGSPSGVWTNTTAIPIKMTTGTSRSNLYFGYLHIHNSGLPIHSRNNHYVTLEKSAIVNNAFSKEGISHQVGDYWTIRWNYWIDNGREPTGGGEPMTAYIACFDYSAPQDPDTTLSDYWEIYGNVFAQENYYDVVDADGLIIAYYGHYWKVWNNSFVNLGSNDGSSSGPLGRLALTGTGISIRNNLWYWMRDYDGTYGVPIASWGGTTPYQSAGDYSWCYYKNTKPAQGGADCSTLPGSNVWTGSEDPFLGHLNGDYRLKTSFSGTSPLAKGENLGGYPYNVYLLFNIRGAGSWDIGALVSGTEVLPSLKRGVSISGGTVR